MNFKQQLEKLYLEKDSKQFTKLVLPYFKKNVDKSDKNYELVMEQIEQIMMKNDLKFLKQLKEKKRSFDLELLIFLLNQEIEGTKKYLVKNTTKDLKDAFSLLYDDLLSKAYSLCLIQYNYDNILHNKNVRGHNRTNHIIKYKTILEILDRTAYPIQILVYSMNINKEQVMGSLKNFPGNYLEFRKNKLPYRKVITLIRASELYLKDVYISEPELCKKVKVNYNSFNRYKNFDLSRFDKIKESITNEELEKLKPLLIK